MKERTGVVALAHPASVLALVVLIVNDHVLKATFGSAITGKLSDIAGAVLVPLLIATLLEPFTRHALRIGMAATATVLAAINTVPAADVLYERSLSLVVPSTNTMDPTDLLAVPFVVVAAHIWNRAHSAERGLRRAWGRTVLVCGLLATTATSNDEPISETFEGTHFLTADEPSVEVAVDFQLGGEDSEIEFVHTEVSTVLFGERADPDVSPVMVTKQGVGTGTITIELRNPELGAAEVSWAMYATGIAAEVCLPFCGGGGDPAVEPTLIVAAPPNSFGPASLVDLDIQVGWGGDPLLHTAEVVLPPGKNGLIVKASHPVDPGVVAVHVAGIVHEVDHQVSTLIPRPEDCFDGCTAPVGVSAIPRGFMRDGTVLGIFVMPEGPGTEASATSTRVPMTIQNAVVGLDVPTVGVEDQSVRIPLTVRVPTAVRFSDVLLFEPRMSAEAERFYNVHLNWDAVRLIDTAAADGCFTTLIEVNVDGARAAVPRPEGDVQLSVRHFTERNDAPAGELEVVVGPAAVDFC